MKFENTIDKEAVYYRDCSLSYWLCLYQSQERAWLALEPRMGSIVPPIRYLTVDCWRIASCGGRQLHQWIERERTVFEELLDAFCASPREDVSLKRLGDEIWRRLKDTAWLPIRSAATVFASDRRVLVLVQRLVAEGDSTEAIADLLIDQRSVRMVLLRHDVITWIASVCRDAKMARMA